MDLGGQTEPANGSRGAGNFPRYMGSAYRGTRLRASAFWRANPGGTAEASLLSQRVGQKRFLLLKKRGEALHAADEAMVIDKYAVLRLGAS